MPLEGVPVKCEQQNVKTGQRQKIHLQRKETLCRVNRGNTKKINLQRKETLGRANRWLSDASAILMSWMLYEQNSWGNQRSINKHWSMARIGEVRSMRSATRLKNHEQEQQE